MASHLRLQLPAALPAAPPAVRRARSAGQPSLAAEQPRPTAVLQMSIDFAIRDPDYQQCSGQQSISLLAVTDKNLMHYRRDQEARETRDALTQPPSQPL